MATGNNNLTTFNARQLLKSLKLKLNHNTTESSYNGYDELDLGTIYAPTTAGTSGQFLKSSGANTAPTWRDFKDLDISLDSTIASQAITYEPDGNNNLTFSLGSFTTHDAQSAINTDTNPPTFAGHGIGDFLLTSQTENFVTTTNYTSKIPLANGNTRGLVYSSNTNVTGYSVAPVVNGFVYYKDFDHGVISITSKDNQITPGHSQTLLNNYNGASNITLELTPHKINAVDLYGDTMQGKLIAAADTTNGSSQVRNVTYSTTLPTASDGQVGDIWIVLEN